MYNYVRKGMTLQQAVEGLSRDKGGGLGPSEDEMEVIN